MVNTVRRRPRQGCPEPAEILKLRQRTKRTQAQLAAALYVSLRQVTRWESGEQDMPAATWRYMKAKSGYRFAVDFEIAAEAMTRGWDTKRDQPRDTIERGDVVELQPISGPLLRATVCFDRVHDGIVGEDDYGATVTSFVGADDAGQEFQGFAITELVWFSRKNVIHIEQAVPRRPSARIAAK
ncbi:helix-turn-helix domain-containing protein [Burkholderia gladioli]|uniref:helix-turn-helix domain-containing protein n=1 Tax=Burkholderia gladioli TaxID=28095 RepID=UPI00164232D4|nr:helix-turn-helix domain-containing protein [Burkholderia gladioli]